MLNLVLSLINSITFVLYVHNLMVFDRRGRPRAQPAPEDSTDFIGMLWEMCNERTSSSNTPDDGSDREIT